MNWLEMACQQGLAFSQVREDPRVDLHLLRLLGPEARITMVASGGCTLASLLASHPLKSVNAVDLNPAQIGLAKFKLHLLKSHGQQTRLQLLGHSWMDPVHRAEQVLDCLAQVAVLPEVFGDQETWSELGLDRCGRYELLFQELGRRLGTDHVRLSRAELSRVFREVMSLNNLVALFGPKATANPAMDFWSHFQLKTLQALARPRAKDNPYLSQMLQGRFNGKPYDWLTVEAPNHWPEIRWTQSTMLEALKVCSGGTQDFVHLSNILDWLTETEAKQTLLEVRRVLRPDGIVVIRQLNSRLKIRSLATGIIWDPALSDELLAGDRSFFYRALHVGRK